MIVLMSLIHIFLIQFFNFNTMQIGMKMRVASCSLIYRKSLKLSKTALAETTIGQMVNLISNDVSRFDYATHFMYHLVMAPIETVVVMYLCYINVGWTGLIGTIFLVLAVPMQCKYNIENKRVFLSVTKILKQAKESVSTINRVNYELPSLRLIRNKVKILVYIYIVIKEPFFMFLYYCKK